MFKNLLFRGVKEEKLRKVHSPIGIDIDAETPEEIAVRINELLNCTISSIAELNEQYSVAVRRMDAGEWLEARTLLEKVHKSQTGFMETER
ncbi:MAG: XdhC/CoxF family protein, partial [Anaerolineaceae bacterium]|nr:XdhC/CoxF family protein [Anaerolineaceae bacterium]